MDKNSTNIKEIEAVALKELESRGAEGVAEALAVYKETKSEDIYSKVTDVLFSKYDGEEDIDTLVDDEITKVLEGIYSQAEAQEETQEATQKVKEIKVDIPKKSNKAKLWYYNNGKVVSLESVGKTEEEAREERKLVLEEDGYFYLNSKSKCIY